LRQEGAIALLLFNIMLELQLEDLK